MKITDNNFEEPLESAVSALLKTPIPDGLAKRIKRHALELDSGSPDVPSPSRRSLNRSSLFRYASMAVVVSAAVVALIMAMPNSSSQLFAQVIESVKNSSGVEFNFCEKGGDKREQSVGTMRIRGRKIRIENASPDGGNIVQIGDLATRKILILGEKYKLAQRIDMSDRFAARFANPVDQLRALKSDGATELGEEFVDGRLANVFRVENASLFKVGDSNAELTLWTDPETALPAKVVVRWPDLKREMHYDGFKWNASISDDLFAKPSDYAMGELLVVGSNPKVQPVKQVADDQLKSGVLSQHRVACAIAWSADGAKLMSVMRDSESSKGSDQTSNQIVQWTLSTGGVNWSHEVGDCDHFTLSTDGTKLAVAISGAEDGTTIQLRKVGTGEVEREWETEDMIGSVEFSPNGELLCGAVMDFQNSVGGVQVWSLDGELEHSFHDDGPTTHIEFSKDGKFVAGGSNGGPAKVWALDAENGKGKLARIIPTSSEFEFSPDGKHFACMPSKPINGDTMDDLQKRYDVQIYEFQTGKLVQTLQSKHTEESWVTHIRYSPDGKLIATANWDSDVRIWDVATGKLLRTIKDHTAGVLVAEFSPDGTRLATGGEDNTLRVWDLQ